MVNSENHIAIILARGGSKRIPQKNIIELNGKPMIAWTIEAAIESRQFERVLVSTDSPDISNVAKKFGAEVPFLRNAAADDITPSSEATLYALDQAEKYWEKSFSTVTQLMANCPLRDHNDIINSFSAFIDADRSSQISCFKFGWMNPWWALKKQEDGQFEQLFPNALSKRSQDLPDLYCPTGAVWISKTDILRKQKTFYSNEHKFEELNWVSALDIDDYNDLEMAKACFKIKWDQRYHY